MNKAPNVIIFDCDGTVLDTYNLIIQVVLKTFEEIFPEYPMTEQEADTFFGPFLNDSFQKYVKTKAEVDYCVDRYRYYCEKMTKDYVKVYDGIEDLLKWLKSKDFKIAIVSNKVTTAIVQGLDICQITKYFDYIVGAEKLKNAKPDPDGIYQVMNHYHIDRSVLIGDTIIDLKTGQNANISMIGVTWCRTSSKTFIENGARYTVNHPSEIKKILEGIYGI